MGIFGNANSYYSGKECYKFVEGLILSGKEILIVSPYIDAYYARFLVENSAGRKMRIVSSSLDPEARKILGRKKPLGLLLAGMAIVLGLDYLSYSFGVLSWWLILFSIAVIATYLSLFRFKRYEIELKIPREFVHVKLYLNEREAIHGSANLTYNGMHKNVEHIEVIREKEKVERLRDEFSRLWD